MPHYLMLKLLMTTFAYCPNCHVFFAHEQSCLEILIFGQAEAAWCSWLHSPPLEGMTVRTVQQHGSRIKVIF
jgi:hypothetical protein